MNAGSDNVLDIALVRALRSHLERLETNPAVTIVILQGQTEGIFSSGTDLSRLQALARGDGGYGRAEPAARALALQYLRDLYSLHHLVATYSKPIVAGMAGAVGGSAWALGQHTAYPYVADNSAVSFPDVAAGLVPSGGASYHLARVPDGAGMWVALTGASVPGETAYWAGLAPLYGSSVDLRETLLEEAGGLSGSVSTGTNLQTDPVYIRAMEALRMFRGEGKALEADDENDDLSAEMYEEYYTLKQWYQQLAAGDEDGAGEILNETAIRENDVLEGDVFDTYRGADSRRQLYPTRFGGEHAGSLENEPAAAAAERRARMGAVSAHSAALFKGTLGQAPSHETSARLGVIRRVFGGEPSAAPVLVALPEVESPEMAHARVVAEVSAAAARASGSSRNALDRNWMERLSKGTGSRAALKALLIQSVEKGSLAPDADLLEMGLTVAAGQAGAPEPTLRLLSPALPIVSLDATIEIVRLGVEAAWPSGQLSGSQWKDIATSVLGVKGVAMEQADNLTSLSVLAVARVTAALHGVAPWALAEPIGLAALECRVASVVQADPRPPKSALPGPSGYLVPEIPKVIVDEDVMPVNPRLFRDPDGLDYEPNEEDNETDWPLTRGSWLGEIEGGGLNDAAPLLPDNTMGLRPALRVDTVGLGVDLLRENVIRMLNVGLGTVIDYTHAAATHAATASNADDGDAAAVRAVMELRSDLLGEAGAEQVRAIMARYKDEEGAGLDTSDIERPGSQAQRARMHLAWPAMKARVRRMRVVVLSGMAAAGHSQVSPEDVVAMANAEVDTLAGRLALAKEATALGKRTHRLVTLYAALVASCTPKQRSAATRIGLKVPEEEDVFDPADLPAALPKVVLPEGPKAVLRAEAAAFAKWEAIVLGKRSGGTWSLFAPSSPARRGLYSLAWMTDAETGVKRLTLQRKVPAAPGQVPPPVRARTPTPPVGISPAGGVAPMQPAAGPAIAMPTFRTISDARIFLEQAAAREASEDSYAGLKNRSGPGGSSRSSLDALGPAHLAPVRYEDRPAVEADPAEAETREVLSGALPDGHLPYREGIAEGPEATAAARALDLMWDWDFVREALTDKSGEGIVSLFSLPTTGRTLAAGAHVTDFYRREADGRVAPSLAGSIAEIVDRLAKEAGGRPIRASSASSSESARAENAEDRYAAVAAAFAAETLRQVQAQPAGALQATHALLLKAGTVSLPEAMAMEHRALVRLLGLGGPGKAFDAKDAKIDTMALLQPLSAELELSLGGRGRAKAQAAKTSAVQARWEAGLEQHLAHGEAPGVIGDMFRRRFVYSPPSVTGIVPGAVPDEDDDSDEEETFHGSTMDLFEEDDAARAELGAPSAKEDGQDEVKDAEDWVDAQKSRQGHEYGDVPSSFGPVPLSEEEAVEAEQQEATMSMLHSTIMRMAGEVSETVAGARGKGAPMPGRGAPKAAARGELNADEAAAFSKLGKARSAPPKWLQ
jgi:enoyl-CoA hydratase/carnithine racemase